ncbi:unnamed protein product [Spirodela intermedia]|uniref:Uncharacterized protein n=1 Tax=Spirodela intermedia TaxID=51605 RepID=A0A7I8LDR9_SPIIN|nr:unnamed protein product [Spirodela intermedia]
MSTSTLSISKTDMLDGGTWKCPTIVFILSPCSTKREAIWVNTTEYMMVQTQMGRSLSTHFTSSTWVIVQSLHRFSPTPLPWQSSGVNVAAFAPRRDHYRRIGPVQTWRWPAGNLHFRRRSDRSTCRRAKFRRPSRTNNIHHRNRVRTETKEK